VESSFQPVSPSTRFSGRGSGGLAQVDPRRGSESLKGLTNHALLPLGARRTASLGFVGRPKRVEADLLIPRWLLAKLPRRTAGDVLIVKDLLTVLPSNGGRTFSGYVAQGERVEVDLFDSTRVVGQVAEENGREAC